MENLIFKLFIPEFFLSFAILFQLIFNARITNALKYNFPLIEKENYSQTLFILFCTLILFFNLNIEGIFENALFVNDAGGKTVKILVIFFCLSILKILFQAFSLQNLNFFEYFTLFLFAILGLLFLISAHDLLSVYVCIEMQALSFYILAAYKRDSVFSTEAGLKYFISGAFFSGIFLFGISLIYGIFGTLNISDLNILLFEINNSAAFKSETKWIFQFGLLLVTFTFLFKIGCAPFHFWTPDVYEGAPLASTIIFSILPKLPLFFFFIKWVSMLHTSFLGINELMLFFGTLSIFLGTFFALNQKRIKKLFIYSSIAQTGFLVVALSLNTLSSFCSLYFFLFIYLITSVLIWGHICMLSVFQKRISFFNNEELSSFFIIHLSNFFYTNKAWSFSFLIILFSVAGIPPLAGFLAKIYIFLNLIESGHIFFAIFSIFISSVSVFYYIKILKIMFFEFLKKNTIKDKKFQITFFDANIDSIFFIFSVFLCILIGCFLYPTMLMLFCQYIVLNSFGV